MIKSWIPTPILLFTNHHDTLLQMDYPDFMKTEPRHNFPAVD